LLLQAPTGIILECHPCAVSDSFPHEDGLKAGTSRRHLRLVAESFGLQDLVPRTSEYQEPTNFKVLWVSTESFWEACRYWPPIGSRWYQSP